MSASLDTNVLLRFALKDVPEQFARAKKLLRRTDIAYVVADAAWAELVYALESHYGLDRPAIIDVIASLMSIDSLRADTETIEAACAAFEAHPKLSFADCYLAAHAAHIGALPLFTFDKKLANQHVAAELVP